MFPWAETLAAKAIVAFAFRACNPAAVRPLGGPAHAIAVARVNPSADGLTVGLWVGERPTDTKALSVATTHRLSPLAGWARSRNVFGNDPSPQILKDPKSLYHSPSGRSGFDSTHIRSIFRSAMLMLRSRIRSIRCWRIPAGSLSQVLR